MAGVHAMAGSKKATPVTVVMNPASAQYASGPTSFYNFVQGVDVSGGVPSSYTWSVEAFGDASWAIMSGQGTNSVTVRVTGVFSVATELGVVTCNVVVNGVTHTLTNNLVYERV